MRKKYFIQLPKHRLDLGDRTLVMGILNVTPDSFSDGGQFLSYDSAIARALSMVSQGADIIDIGGESTRPGALPVSVDEEISRVIPVIKALRERISIPISIDTYKATVADAAIVAGAEIINDISGLKFDSEIATVAAKSRVALCIMHTRGTPQTMQQLPASEDIWGEISQDFNQSIEIAESKGVTLDRLILDPGIGFGKTLTDNLSIIGQLDRLRHFDLPILIGTSRKSFIGKVLEDPAADRLMGTAASVACAIMRGAHIVRIHDVAPMIDIARISDAISRYATI